MKRIIYCLLTAVFLTLSSTAKEKKALDAVSVRLDNVKIERSESFLHCNFTVSLAGYKVGTDQELRLCPFIVGEDGNELELPSVSVAGRSRFIHLQRLGKKTDIPGLHRYRKDMTLPYSVSVAYQPWMEQSRVELRETSSGCCAQILSEYTMPVDSLDFREIFFEAVPVFIAPTADAVKARSLSGRAFVDFPVNKTVIYPEYHDNIAELAKIKASIDSVRDNKDITITSIAIKGFASPEGSYKNNERLAKGRTEALKKYVRDMYDFRNDLIKTSYEPEDWEGLRDYVKNSDLRDREAILAVIDSDLAPDARDNRLRTSFPEQYRFLLKEVYPGLRHSDYKVDYTIRTYTDPAEIVRVMYTRPQDLTLNEFFVAARALEPGSQEYNDLFETAVRMYPDSEIANLNAAASAIIRGDLVSAERYLNKAGETPEAIYTRGNLAALQVDYPKALEQFERAAKLRIAEAPAAAEQVRALMKRKAKRK